MFIDKVEEIMHEETLFAYNAGFHAGHKDGYGRGICVALVSGFAVYLCLLAPLLSKELNTFDAANLTQCLTVWPEQACSAYCNSPTFLR
jgi:hypothetical protein